MRQIFILAALALIGWSCNNKEEVTGGKGEATMTITLAGTKATSKAIGVPTQVEENAIHNFTVYIFRPDNTLEKVRTFFSSTLTQRLEGLTEGPKKVVVLANPTFGFPELSVGDSYAVFSEELSKINLSTQQELATSGLMMSGEVAATLQPSPIINTVTVNVSRIVAKVKLGTITIQPAQGHGGVFTLSNVVIMDAPSMSSVGLPNITTTEPLYGGLPGIYVVGPDNVKQYLNSEISVAMHDNVYFYLFADADHKTMLTLVGEYNGQTSYFPFILDPIGRNTQNTINITLRRLGSGSPGPDIPSDPTVMDITVVPQDWYVMPVQNEEW